MIDVSFDANQTLVIAIVAYFTGRWLTQKIGFLDRFRIPEAVPGGLLVAVFVTVLRYWGSVALVGGHGTAAAWAPLFRRVPAPPETLVWLQLRSAL